MQIQHPVNTELQSGAFSVLVGGFGAICAQQHLQAQQTIGLCDTLRAPCTQITQQTPGCMPQGKTVAARPASPCCGSGPGVSTPSQADAAGSFGTARAGANGDMADSRGGHAQPELQQLSKTGVAEKAASLSAAEVQLAHPTPATAAVVTTALMVKPQTAAAATPAAADMTATSSCTASKLQGSHLLQQLEALTCSLLEAARLQDRPRQRLLLRLLSSFPCTPALLLASQAGTALRQVLQFSKRRQLDANCDGVAAAVRMLQRRWRALLAAQVAAAGNSSVARAWEALQDTPVAKKQRLMQQPGDAAAAAAAAYARTQPSQQQQPQARSNSIMQPLPPAAHSRSTAPASHRNAASNSKLLSPPARFQQVLNLSTATTATPAAAAAAAPAKPRKQTSKRSRHQQETVLALPAKAPKLAQHQNQLQQQASHVKRGRARNSIGQPSMGRQPALGAAAHAAAAAADDAAAAAGKEQRLSSSNSQLQQESSIAAVGLQRQGQQLVKQGAGQHGVHASWLSAFSNGSRASSSAPGATADNSKTGAAASTPAAAGGAVTGFGGGRDAFPAGGAAAAGPLAAVPPAAAVSTPTHHPTPHVSVISSSRSLGSPGSPGAKGQQNLMWGAGAIALRAAKAPAHHADHHHKHHHGGRGAHQAHGHTAHGAYAGGSSHALNRGWPPEAAATASEPSQAAAGSHIVNIVREGAAAGGSGAAKQQGANGGAAAAAAGLLAGAPAPMAAAAALGAGATLNGYRSSLGGGVVEAVRPGSEPLAGFGSGVLGFGFLAAVEGEDDEGPVLVDTRQQHGGSLLAAMDSMGGFVLSPELQ